MMDRNAASSRMDHGMEGAQAEWLSAMQSLAEQIQKQQQNSQQMIQELMNTYIQLLNTPGSYLSGQAEQQQQTLQQTAQQWMEQAQQQQQSFQEQAQQQQQSFQQMTQEAMSTYSQLFNIPLSYAKEGLKDAKSSPSRATTNLPWKRPLGVWGHSPPKILGRFAITRSATRTERRSSSSWIAG